VVEEGRIHSKGYMYVLVKAEREEGSGRGSGRGIGKLERQNSSSGCRVLQMTSARRWFNVRWVQYPLLASAMRRV